MTRSILSLAVCGVLVVLGVLMVSPASAQIPRGFEFVNITDDPVEDRFPMMNNCGEVVFHKALPRDRLGVFLYDNGKTSQVSVDGDYNTFPDINDDGVIVWSQWDNGTPMHIVIYEDGLITQLTDEPLDDLGPLINNLGHIVWHRSLASGCAQGDTDIMFYDGTTIEQVTDNGSANQLIWMNDRDDIAWTVLDFCVNPWEGHNFLLLDGVTIPLPGDPQLQPQNPAINNRREVVWGSNAGLHFWVDGVATLITDWGEGPSINDRGEIIFHRWHDDEGVFALWLYRDGEFSRITGDSYTATVWGFTNDGEAAWKISPPEPTDIGIMRRIRNGDVDLDFEVDTHDFAGLPACMTGPVDTDHLCACRFFDIEHDRDIDLADFAAFQNLFTGD